MSDKVRADGSGKEAPQGAEPTVNLTKTEAYVLACRRRGMTDTAIRRLLQLSREQAVAFGLAAPQDPARAPEVWPDRAGRRLPSSAQRPAESRRREEFCTRVANRNRRDKAKLSRQRASICRPPAARDEGCSS